jgi:hypothetical protein
VFSKHRGPGNKNTRISSSPHCLSFSCEYGGVSWICRIFEYQHIRQQHAGSKIRFACGALAYLQHIQLPTCASLHHPHPHQPATSRRALVAASRTYAQTCGARPCVPTHHFPQLKFKVEYGLATLRIGARSLAGVAGATAGVLQLAKRPPSLAARVPRQKMQAGSLMAIYVGVGIAKVVASHRPLPSLNTQHTQMSQCRVCFLRAERKGAAAMRVREVRRAPSGDAGR